MVSYATNNCDTTKPDEVQVRTLYTGISRGTESLVFRGEVPPSQYLAMRAPFQQGQFPAPVKYGYSNVGVVEMGRPRCSGQPVFCTRMEDNITQGLR